jgi:hypothetical protein
LNLDDVELPVAPGSVLDSDMATSELAGAVAPHGWSITERSFGES